MKLSDSITINELNELEDQFKNSFMTMYGNIGGYFASLIKLLDLSKTESNNYQELSQSIIKRR